MSYANVITTGNKLSVNDSLVSPQGKYQLTYQSDGNLVLHSLPSKEPIWASNTAGTTPKSATMQADGNWVIRSTSGQVWASNTSEYPSSILALQDDGNIVIYYGGVDVWSSNTCHTPRCDILNPNQALFVNNALTSLNGNYQLIFHEDGRLVLYEVAGNKPLWISNTTGHNPHHAIMQTDGDLVVHDLKGNILWSSGSSTGSKTHGAWLILQDDGNLVVYYDNEPLWSSNTHQAHHQPRTALA